MERALTLTGGQCFPRDSLTGRELPGPVDATFCRSKIPLTSESHPHVFRTANKAIGDYQVGGIKAVCEFHLFLFPTRPPSLYSKRSLTLSSFATENRARWS